MTDQELQNKRLIAAAIDGGIAVALSVVFGIGGVVLGFVVRRASDYGGTVAVDSVHLLGSLVLLGYILARDVLAGGRSFGKQSQGLRVVTTQGQPVTFAESAKRNVIFAVSAFLNVVSALIALVPCVGWIVNCLLWPVWILGGLAALAAVIIEVVKITQDPEGVRLGDQFAGTRVTY